MRLQTFIPILFFRVSNVAFSLLITFVAVRYLSAQANELFYTLSVVFVLVPVIAFGIPESIVRNNSQPSGLSKYFPIYLTLGSFIGSLFVASYLRSLNVSFIILLTCSLSLSVYYSEISRVKGKFFISTLLNNSLFSIFLLLPLLATAINRSIDFIVAASVSLSIYIVLVVLVGRKIKIKESGVLNSRYLNFSFKLMLATALASLWDNLDIICISSFQLDNSNDAVPVLRLVRGYAFPGIVLGYILAPKLGKIASEKLPFTYLSNYRYVYIMVACMVLAMAMLILYFSEEIFNILFGSVSSVAIEWNRAIIFVQTIKSLFVPFFIYLNFLKPHISIYIVAGLSLLKVLCYYFFRNEALLIYEMMGLLYIALIVMMTLITLKK